MDIESNQLRDVVATRVPTFAKKALNQIAIENNLTKSELIRKIIEIYLFSNHNIN
jgi:predicted DNA-binding protein